MGKEKLSEEDIKARYITPAVEQSCWDKKQIRYEYAFTAGRIILRGNVTSRGKQKRIVAKIEELLPYCDQLIK